MWDEWHSDSDDDGDKYWEHWKQDTNGDGKFDQEWKEGDDDDYGNHKPDEGEWKNITPEEPDQDHPKDR